jgi:outer membrane protein
MIGRLTHAAVALLAAASLVVSPVYAQAQGTQTQEAQQAAQSSSQPQAQPAAPDQSRDLRLSVGPDYSKGKPFFPDLAAPYSSMRIPLPPLTNSPRLQQLIQDGKLMLSLEDAISLVLENNLDITVQRFTPWLAQANLLRTKAGGASYGTGVSAPILLGSTPSGGFDPILTSSITLADETQPVINPYTSGTGSSAVSVYSQHVTTVDFGYSQTFHEGTNVSLSWNNTRTSTSVADILNPNVESQLVVTISQPFLKGFGFLPNTRYIIEAKNTLKVADAQFALAVINDVTTVSNYYWELVYSIENVKVNQAAVGVSQKLYEDNKKQLEIGTMAPLDVLTAESQLATDQQNLIVAQTTKLQDETILLNAITKNPLDPSLMGVEIVPTTPISAPEVTENIPIQDAVQEAWTKRPEIQQAEYNLKNEDIEVRATKNALLPTLSAYAVYAATGIGGNATVNTSTTPSEYEPVLPIIDGSGNLVSPPIFAGEPVYPTMVMTGGVGDALNTMIKGNYPSFIGGINFSLPIRNRSAQADNAQAQLQQRQQKVAYRQLQNSIFQSVRNALILLTQSRSQVAAAEKAETLAAQTLDAEQKKYQLGSSTSYNVVLRSRDLTTAQGTLLRARVNLIEASVNLNMAMGRTLDANRITMADARTGKMYREPNIPGTPETVGVSGR